jgi:hypothetical protein
MLNKLLFLGAYMTQVTNAQVCASVQFDPATPLTFSIDKVDVGLSPFVPDMTITTL